MTLPPGRGARSGTGVAAIVLAAGGGTRIAAAVNKVFLPVDGETILGRSLGVFDRLAEIETIVVVIAETDRDAVARLVAGGGYAKVERLVAGGGSRHASEYCGLLALADDIATGRIELVLVHDAARPFVTPDRLLALIGAARETGAAILATPAPDELVTVDLDDAVTNEAAGLWVAQTPQAFRAALALEAHRRAADDGFIGTDTSAVVERSGTAVSIVVGRPDNIKITTADDLVRAELIAEGLRAGAAIEVAIVTPRL